MPQTLVSTWGRLLALVVLPAMLTAAGVASATPTWLPASPIGWADRPAGQPEVVLDRDGNATVVWVRGGDGAREVLAAWRPAGGAWSAPVTVSAAGRDTASPDVGVDGAGRVTIVWVDVTDTLYQVMSTSRLPNAGWSEPTPVSTAATGGVSLGVDQAGNAVAVWLDEVDAVRTVRAASRPPQGTWAAAESLGTAAAMDPYLTPPRVAVDPVGGAATAVWLGAEDEPVLQASRRPPGGAWLLAEPLSSELPGAAVHQFAVTVDGQGTSTVVWTALGFGTGYHVRSSRAGVAGAWSQPDEVSDRSVWSDGGDRNPELASNAQGDVVVAWRVSMLDAQLAIATTRPAGGGWQRPKIVGHSAYPLMPVVSLTPLGTSYVSWQGADGEGAQALVVSRPPGGDWSEPVRLGESYGEFNPVEPRGALSGADAYGDVVALFTGSMVGDTDLLWAAPLDVAGPRLSDLDVPVSATVGKTYSAHAAATDTWSAVSSYVWSFGDGGSATGTVVSHVYAHGGAYDVTLTVTDAVGNATVQTTRVIVSHPVKPVPRLSKFKLTSPVIRALDRTSTDAPRRTRLQLRLNTAARVKVVLVSRHRHTVNGHLKAVRVVVIRRLPAGDGTIVLRARVAGTELPVDAYRMIGVARNSAGSSAERRLRLVVVEPGPGK